MRDRAPHGRGAPALRFEPAYKRLPSRQRARGQLVSFVIPFAQLRASRLFAFKRRWPVSEVYRVATEQFLARQKKGGK
jgi:hypothetical protein